MLLKRWKVIVSITMIETIVSAAVSFFVISPKYEAKTKLFIGKEYSHAKDQLYNSNDLQMYQKLLKTYVEIISTKDLVGQTVEDENMQLKSSDVLKSLTVTPRADTQILEISYTNTNLVIAKGISSSSYRTINRVF